eukprot:5510802-Pleurochrysis_carterae.AAC.1
MVCSRTACTPAPPRPQGGARHKRSACVRQEYFEMIDEHLRCRIHLAQANETLDKRAQQAPREEMKSLGAGETTLSRGGRE